MSKNQSRAIIMVILSISWCVAGISIGQYIYSDKNKCMQVIENKDLKRVGNLSYERGWHRGLQSYDKALKNLDTAAEAIELYRQRDSLSFATEIDTLFK